MISAAEILFLSQTHLIVLDVTYYPFDAQYCELKFASWTTEVNRVS
jgi:hypothetical protein